MIGNHDERKLGQGVILMCMDPTARELMDTALREHRKHVASIREWKPGHRQSVYGFAYWLFRWSGLVGPDGKTST